MMGCPWMGWIDGSLIRCSFARLTGLLEGVFGERETPFSSFVNVVKELRVSNHLPIFLPRLS